MTEEFYKKYSHILARYIVPISIFLVIFVISIVSYAAVLSYNEKWDSSRKFAENILQSKMREVYKNLELYNRALSRTVDTVHEIGAGNIPHYLKEELLFDASPSVNGLDELFVFDQDGELVARSSGIPGKVPNIKNCPYFALHRMEAVSEFYLDDFCPVFSPGEPLSLAMSRRLSKRDGSFAGVAVAKISLSYISDSFQDLSIGRDGVIFLAKDNGTLLIRVPAPSQEGIVGRDFSKSSIYEEIRKAKSGSFIQSSIVDGINRFYIYSYFNNVPLIMGVAISKDAIIKEWYKHVIAIVGGTVLVCFSMIVVAVIVRKEIIRREEIEKELEKLSVTDSLTGLFNRRYFDEKIETEWRRGKRVQSPLAILMIDADDFKQLNDSYGHLEGDQVLIKISRSIKHCLRRAGDFATRYGGDEFIAVLPDTDRASAGKIAGLIRKQLRALNANNGDALQGNGSVSISIGIASLIPSNEYTPQDLVSMADEDLYRVKADRKGKTERQLSELIDNVE